MSPHYDNGGRYDNGNNPLCPGMDTLARPRGRPLIYEKLCLSNDYLLAIYENTDYSGKILMESLMPFC